ncbi:MULTISPECIES: hypothetical protein [unclassified Sedimentibacter]|nr:hypothetical protein [Sedimentibacter sp. MB35-C1]WMJ78456.1 hypothetical protein RBQ61_05920 [Sedimentibacter sp. MB35-C1]
MNEREFLQGEIKKTVDRLHDVKFLKILCGLLNEIYRREDKK